jgi:N-acetylmuramoyl-L-alanine amidase
VSQIVVYLDGVRLYFDVDPVIEDGRTLVPMRGIFEAIGADLSWDSETQTVVSVMGTTTVILQVGSTTSTVNGEAVTLDVPARIINDRTMAPLRFVGEAFGCVVEWDGATRTINIITGC